MESGCLKSRHEMSRINEYTRREVKVGWHVWICGADHDEALAELPDFPLREGRLQRD